MTSTIDPIAPGRFGVNLITGWAKTEYDQMGLWPGDDHYEHRYDMLGEYTTILRQLWTEGRSDFKGRFYTMNDCRLSPRPSGHVRIVCAGQSPRGMQFGAAFADYNFCVALARRLLGGLGGRGRRCAVAAGTRGCGVAAGRLSGTHPVNQ